MNIGLHLFWYIVLDISVVAHADTSHDKIEYLLKTVEQLRQNDRNMQNEIHELRTELTFIKKECPGYVHEDIRQSNIEVMGTDEAGTDVEQEKNVTMEIKEEKRKRLLDNTGDLHQMQLNVQSLTTDVATLKSEVTNLKSIKNHSIKRGFTARLAHATHDLGYNQHIIFDYALTNIGNNYNPLTGMFTCDFPGVYVFFVHTLTMARKHVETEMVKNTEILAYTFARDTDDHSSGSNLAVVELVAGDVVFIRAHGSAHDVTGAVLDPSYTSFSGFLINY